MTIADRVKRRRIELGMSQQDLADKAGYCGKTVISRFEHAADDISLKQVKRLADALDTSLEYLMGWQAEKQMTPIEQLLQEKQVQQSEQIPQEEDVGIELIKVERKLNDENSKRLLLYGRKLLELQEMDKDLGV